MTTRRLGCGLIVAVTCLTGIASLFFWRANTPQARSTKTPAARERALLALKSHQLEWERRAREKEERARQQVERETAVKRFPGLAGFEAKGVFFHYENGCPVFVSFADVVPLPNDDDIDGLGEFNTLQTIVLERAPISGRGFASLQSLPVTAIGLTDTVVDDIGLAEIVRISQLEKLYLGHTLVTDQGIKLLTSLTRLRELYLTGTSIGNASVAYLQQIKSLESVNLMGTSIDSSGIAALHALPKLKNLMLSKRMEKERDAHEAALPGCKISYW
jgi:hypothetical protein